MYRFTLAVLLGLFIHQVHAQTLGVEKDAPLTVGALASIHQSAYHVDDKITAVPLLLYDNNRFYLEGTDAGFYPYKDNKHWVRAGISYDRQHYNSKDAKTAALQSLNKRQSSVNAQVSYMYISAIGGIETKLATDILGRSNGQTVSLAHRSKFELLDNKLTVYPKAGITWHSKKYNDYYYGISDKESLQSGIHSYDAKAGFSPFVAVSGKYMFTDKIGSFANVRHDWLSSSQKNSPMTDGKTETFFNVGLTYDF